MDHNQEQIRRIRELFEAAYELPVKDRAAYLDSACSDDPEARSMVERLLQEEPSHTARFEHIDEELIGPSLHSLKGHPQLLEDWLDGQVYEKGENGFVGKTVGHFKIQELIGCGGMGIVYKAYDQRLERTVALKFLPPAFNTDPLTKDRFINEAKVTSGLDHPNIATIYEIGETSDKQMFIAMGYYPGETMKDMIARGPIAQKQVIRYAIQLASALNAVHQRDIIHRDIKPGNIIITGDDSVKLLDFGLAKLSYASGYTQIGQLLGTVAYMSPEQARGRNVDNRTDLWSLGVVLYEMLTGSLPFTGEDASAALHAIIFDNPRKPQIPVGEGSDFLSEILGLCLAKDPDQRYQNASELLEDLERVRDGMVPARRSGRKTWNRRSRRKLMAGLIGLAGTIAVAAMVLLPTAPSRSTDYKFTRITEGTIVEKVGNFMGCMWGDYDSDGLLDVLVTENDRENGSILLYHNDGDGVFRAVSGAIEGAGNQNPFSAYWADQDNDGDLDLFVATDTDHAQLFYRNQGDGTFIKETEGEWLNTPFSAHAVAWGDYDNDGWIDLFVPSANETVFRSNMLYRNKGDGSMERVENDATRILGVSHGALWSDHDGDGDLDLFVAGQDPVQFRNDGSGNLIGVANEENGRIPEYTRDVDIGFSSADYDNDNDLDVAYTVWGPGVLLYRNELRNAWNDISYLLPFDGWIRGMGTSWGDYDNDGYIDLFVTAYNGRNFLFHNERGERFSLVEDSPVIEESLHTGGAGWGDYDNDGDLDLLVANGVWSDFGESCELFRNEGGPNHWIVITLKGTVSNRSAIGAKVKAMARIGNRQIAQLREVQSGGNTSSDNLRVHFGLGDAIVVDILRIEWPSGIVQEFQDIAADQFLTIEEVRSPGGLARD